MAAFEQHPFNLDSSLLLPNINNSLSMFDQISFNNNNSTYMDHHDLYPHHHKYNDDIMTPKKMNKHPSFPNSSQSKKGKKQKKMGNDVSEAPTGYIHVRARRGQATDNHSLAERVRREKISERMKLLQAIVPGCDKVSGKALMLDEIINYVQSLQNQVEFLSMKLAYVNPMYYDFGMDLESSMISPEDDQVQVQVQDLSNSVAVGSMQECSPTTVNKHPHLLDTYFLFQQQAAGCRQTLWEVEDGLRQNNNTIINNQSGSGSGSGIQQQPVFFPLV